jgi:PTS system nitrogen regulatory IIA component
MQYGVAIPHGKTSTVDDLAVAFALKKEGIDFSSLDGQPSRIFIMTISSSNRTGPHIQYLSEISKLLNSPLTRQRLLNAVSVEEITDILTSS